MKVLTGKNALLFIKIDGTYYPALCAISCSIQYEVEEILKTSRTTGLNRTRKGRLIDWGISLTGLSKINNADGQVGFMWLLQRPGATLEFKLRYTDDDGNVVNITGSMLNKSGKLDSVVGGFSTASHYFPGTGAYSTDADPGIILPELHVLYLSTTEGAFEVTDAELGDILGIMLVLREEGGYKEVAGTPTGRQFRFTDNTTSGTITFSSALPFNPGEIVTVQYTKAS